MAVNFPPVALRTSLRANKIDVYVAITPPREIREGYCYRFVQTYYFTGAACRGSAYSSALIFGIWCNSTIFEDAE